MAENNSSAPLKTAGEPFVALGECIADQVCLSVAELPDRDSPADWPQAMLVTSDELRNIVLNAINYAAQAVEAQAAPNSEQHGWQTIETAPKDQLVMVYTPPTIHDYPDSVNIRFDHIDSGIADDYWHEHGEHYEHYCCVAKPEGSIGPNAVAPYTHWHAIPAAPSLAVKKAAPAQLAPAPFPVPPKAITANLMIDDGGERPVYCLMAAYPSEADATAALAALAATPALPATDSSAGDLAEVRAEPVIYVSRGQLENHTDPESDGGRYLPARRTPLGLLNYPLYTAPQAQPADRLDADTFWVADDPDAAHDTLHDAVVAAFEGGGVHPGGFVEIGCSASRPSLLVRITSDQPFRFVVEHDAAMAAAQEGGKA